jgi:hypothetical protein
MGELTVDVFEHKLDTLIFWRVRSTANAITIATLNEHFSVVARIGRNAYYLEHQLSILDIRT